MLMLAFWMGASDQLQFRLGLRDSAVSPKTFKQTPGIGSNAPTHMLRDPDHGAWLWSAEALKVNFSDAHKLFSAVARVLGRGPGPGA